jgi:LysR family transcriptional regulator, glycine cleavage system transcriptional activator
VPSALPPLRALRVFEAAARLLSFTRAADELHLTQGAVSRQVRLLEDSLGKPLFVRLVRQVELTEDGRELFAAVRGALREIEAAAARIRADGHRRVVTLQVLPTLASLWLMPRLAAFSSGRPDIEVRIVTGIGAAPFATGSIDAAITCGPLPGKRYGKAQPRVDLQMVDDWAGVEAEPLFPDRLVPVLSRRLAEAHGPIRAASDLLRVPLIHTATRSNAWPDWLRANGVEWRRAPGDLDFGHFFMSLQAAREGRGAAIVPTVLLNHYEGSNELASPLPANIESAAAYYLLTHERTADEPHVRLLRDWLLAEAQSARARA